MAFSSLYNSFSLIFIFGLFALPINRFARANDASLIENVCHQTKAESLCLSILRSDYEANNATSPKQLAEIVIGSAKFKAVLAKDKIHILLNFTKLDRKVKLLYFLCQSYYLQLLSALSIASDDLTQGRYADLKTNAQFVNGRAARCEATFMDVKSPFTSENEVLEVYGQAIAALAGILSHSTSFNNHV